MLGKYVDNTLLSVSTIKYVHELINTFMLECITTEQPFQLYQVGRSSLVWQQYHPFK